MKIKINFLFLFLIFSTFSFAQVESYEPLSSKPKSASRTVLKMQKRFARDIKNLPKKNRRELEDFYETRFENTRAKLLNGHFLFQDSINRYFDQILLNIMDANPKVRRTKDVRFFLSRYYWPNASCLGEGTLIMNIGLLRRLENESQVAFVLAHELAHLILNHVNSTVHKRVAKLNSSQARRVIRDMKKERYNANQQADEFLKDVVFDHRKHSRNHEAEADSLAIILLQNTPYDLNQGIRVLEILDEIDKEKYPDNLKLKEKFNSPEYKFRSRWLMKETGLSMAKSDDFAWDTDSLKTHPDCKDRIVKLKRIIPTNYESGQINIQTDIAFESLVRIADFEMIASTYEFGNYGRALYYCLQLLEKYPDNAWLHATVGISFFDIYVAQEDHTLSRFVDLPSKKYHADYRELMQFIQNIRLKEIANISYFYIKNKEEAFEDNEHYLYALMLTADIIGEKDEVKKYKRRYLSDFPKGRYRKHVREF
ncbi:MAG: Zn-dependent protease with chaperone function [Saprospiraceae bacterium]|jgi:Zn-dependent protease with chaperone function